MPPTGKKSRACAVDATRPYRLRPSKSSTHPRRGTRIIGTRSRASPLGRSRPPDPNFLPVEATQSRPPPGGGASREFLHGKRHLESSTRRERNDGLRLETVAETKRCVSRDTRPRQLGPTAPRASTSGPAHRTCPQARMRRPPRRTRAPSRRAPGASAGRRFSRGHRIAGQSTTASGQSGRTRGQTSRRADDGPVGIGTWASGSVLLFQSYGSALRAGLTPRSTERTSARARRRARVPRPRGVRGSRGPCRGTSPGRSGVPPRRGLVGSLERSRGTESLKPSGIRLSPVNPLARTASAWHSSWLRSTREPCARSHAPARYT